jgi:hypothetical protein
LNPQPIHLLWKKTAVSPTENSRITEHHSWFSTSSSTSIEFMWSSPPSSLHLTPISILSEISKFTYRTFCNETSPKAYPVNPLDLQPVSFLGRALAISLWLCQKSHPKSFIFLHQKLWNSWQMSQFQWNLWLQKCLALILFVCLRPAFFILTIISFLITRLE